MKGQCTMATVMRASSLLRDMTSSDHLPFGARGIRIALILLNICVLISGCGLCVLGYEIDGYLELRADIIFTPVLWWLGVGPIIIGLLGIGAGLIAQKRWVTVWVATSIFLGSLTYIVMSTIGCLDSENFGVAIQVFGQCHDHKEHCVCIRDNGSALLLNHSTCANARHVTRLYVAMVTTLTLCITCLVTSMVLACVGACCVQHCQDKFYRSAYCDTTTIAYSPSHLGPPSTYAGGSMMSLNESPDMLHPGRYLSPERSTSYISLSPTTMVTEIGMSGRSSRTNSVAV